MMLIIWILVGVVLFSVGSWALQELLALYFDNIPKSICAVALVIIIIIMLLNRWTNISINEMVQKICMTIAVVSYGIGILMDIYS